MGNSDVSGMVQSFSLDKLGASVVTNTETEQAIALGGPIDEVTEFRSLSDDDNDDARGTYARLRDNKEGPWGAWMKR